MYVSCIEPSFEEDDVFRIIVPLDDAYSYDFGRRKKETNETNCATGATNQKNNVDLSVAEMKILKVIKANPMIAQKVLVEKNGISLGTIKRMKINNKGEKT